VTTSSLSPAAPRRSGWFADRTLTQKFGALIGVTLLSTGGLLTAVLIGDSKKEAASAELADLSQAQSLVLQIDTRASELKVDGYKALVRPNAADELEELAGDIETPQAMIAELDGIPLSGAPAAAVADVRRPSSSTPTPSRRSSTTRSPTRRARGSGGKPSRPPTT
jgi:hypothetical protein